MLVEWNEKINLTAITKKDEVYLKHFYDSLTISKIIDLNKEYTLCDMGSGAGFPGIVLKIIFPKLKITLVDSLNKRINFLNEVIKDLNLKDIEAIHARVEEFSKKNIEKYDLVTARAVAHLNILLEYGVPMLQIGGKFIAMKGSNSEIEESENALKKLNCKVIHHQEFNLPIENSKRNLILIEKMTKTSGKYPRKYSEIKKQRL